MKNTKQQHNILIVDDTPENLRLLATALQREGYVVRVAPTGDLALNMANTETPDLIILDIDMPDMNGYEVCEALKENRSLSVVPVIFLSALQDTQSKVMAFERGGVDYTTKPFIIEELLARVATHLELHQLRKDLEFKNRSLFLTVSDQEHEIYAAQISTIVALAKLAESRDDDTGMHIDRVGFYSKLLAIAAKDYKKTKTEIDEAFIETIYHASALHDIGKVGITDSILQKPGKLSPEEFEIMKAHPVIGFNTLNAVLNSYPNNKMIRMGADIAKCHHEKWNGDGYPEGLRGEQIPLSARIIAIADVYDALRSKRPYKKPFTHEEAVKIIQEGCGQHFDPDLINIFETIHQSFDKHWDLLQIPSTETTI